MPTGKSEVTEAHIGQTILVRQSGTDTWTPRRLAEITWDAELPYICGIGLGTWKWRFAKLKEPKGNQAMSKKSEVTEDHIGQMILVRQEKGNSWQKRRLKEIASPFCIYRYVCTNPNNGSILGWRHAKLPKEKKVTEKHIGQMVLVRHNDTQPWRECKLVGIAVPGDVMPYRCDEAGCTTLWQLAKPIPKEKAKKKASEPSNEIDESHIGQVVFIANNGCTEWGCRRLIGIRHGEEKPYFCENRNGGPMHSWQYAHPNFPSEKPPKIPRINQSETSKSSKSKWTIDGVIGIVIACCVVIGVVGLIVFMIGRCSCNTTIDNLEKRISSLQKTVKDHHLNYRELVGKDAFFGQKNKYHYFSLDESQTWWSVDWSGKDGVRRYGADVNGIKLADPEHVIYLRARAGLIEQLEDLFPEREDAEKHIDQMEKCVIAKQKQKGD